MKRDSLFDRVREIIRLKHYSIRTEQSYLSWIKAGENFRGDKKAYPNITDEDIRACIGYASILADEEARVAV